MKFRNKILLAIWSVVFGLLIAGYVLVNYLTRASIEERSAQFLRTSRSTVAELNALRLEEVSRSSQIIAETPRLKAVVELSDRNTIRQLAKEFNNSTLADFFLLTDPKGLPLAQLVDGQFPAITLSPPATVLQALSGMTVTDLWNLDTMVFRCASSPVMVGADLLGTATIGNRIDDESLASMKTLTGSDIILVVGNRSVASTLEGRAQTELAEWIAGGGLASQRAAGQEVVTLGAAGDRYGLIFCPLNATVPTPTHVIGVLLVRGIGQEVRAVLRPVMETFLLLSIIVLVVTVGIGLIISRGITRPIAALVRGTTEVSQGNYDQKIEVGGGEELSFLARKFEEMSQSLKEKIGQLAEQNTELDLALRKLRQTQDELVKSERLAATGSLTAQLSHEINNPIHNIQSCLQTALKRTAAGAPGRDLLEVAVEEVDRLARLTQQLLNVFRTSMVQEPGIPLSLNKVIEEVLVASGEELKTHRVAVELLLCPSLPMVLGSADKLKQVFLNLFLNARDAMPEGGGLRIETAKTNGDVRVTVADTGIGIPAANIHRIFDAFFTTKHKVSGVGLGLSVTYGIVRQHNGSIEVKSEGGSGTTFTLRFPSIAHQQDTTA